MKRIFLLTILFLGTISVLAYLNIAKAQNEPFILITFKGLNYAPSDYQGKVLPIQNSPVVASVALIQNGKFINISDMQINWLIDNQPYRSGIGLSTIIFQEPDLSNRFSSTNVEAEFPNYPGGFILNSISFTPGSPQVIIENTYPNSQFNGQSVSLKLIPYFFNIRNIQDLNISWSINGQSPTNLDNPETLDVQLPNSPPPGSTLNVSLSVQSKLSQLEAAQNQISLIYQNQ